MIRLSAAKAELAIVENEVVTSGAQRVFACAFALSEDWDGLNRTAVFRAGTRSVSVLLGGGNTAEIPWEVLQTPGITLHIGLYGAGADGLVLPTVWAEIGMIRPGAYPGGDALPPTPGAYDQLVEIAENAEKIAQSVRDDADKGAFDGEPGPAGPQGPQGEPGRDGVQIDNAAVSSTETWSSRKIIDTLCPKFSVSGNPVTCTPVEGYPLGVTVTLEPVQAGEGEPSPENIRPISGRDAVSVTRCGKNLLDMARAVPGGKAYGLIISIDGDLVKIDGMPSSAVTEEKMYTFNAIKAGQPEIQGKGLQIAAFGDAQIVTAYGLSTASSANIDVGAILSPNVEFHAAFRLMVSVEKPAAYEPYSGQDFTLVWPADTLEIPALSGENTLVTTGDSLTVTGRADPLAAAQEMERRMAAIEQAFTSTLPLAEMTE